MSLSVKEIISLAEKQLADSGVENAGGDAKSLYFYMTAIPESKIILEYQNVLQDLLCDRSMFSPRPPCSLRNVLNRPKVLESLPSVAKMTFDVSRSTKTET